MNWSVLGTTILLGKLSGWKEILPQFRVSVLLINLDPSADVLKASILLES